MPNHSRTNSIIAVDARLIGAQSTGDSTYWSGLLYGLSRIDHDLRIVLFSNTPRPDVSWLQSFEWVTLPARSSRWWSLVTFPLAAKRMGASAIHTQYSLSPLSGAIGITTVHDVSFFIGPEWFRPRDRVLLQTTVPRGVRRAAQVITVSETSRNELLRYIPVPEGKVHVTPNACPPWIQPSGEAPLVDGPYVMTVGTRWPRKNMDLAVRAMSLLAEDLPHRLVVTGKQGWGNDDLGSRGVATGYVSNEQLSALYSHADLYLAPSRHEGFGIPVLEAFRCGCPVLASSGGALPEVVGDAGIVEGSWEPEDWAESISRLLRDRSTLDRLERKGREREKLYTWENCATKTVEIYQRVAKP